MRYAILAIFLASGTLYATPVIDDIVDTTDLQHGNTLTISGTNFTAYSTTTGTFDTFESGSFSPYWSSHNNLTLPGVEQRNVNSSINTTALLTASANDDAALQGGSPVSRSWYVSFWWKVGTNWDWGTSSFSGTDKWLSNIKMIRFWNPGAFAENVYMAFAGFNGTLELLEEGYAGAPVYFLHVGPALLTLDTWHEFRFQFVDSSSIGVADGSVTIWFDTMTIYNATGKLYKEDEDINKRPQRIGFQNVWGCNEGTPDTEGCNPGTFWMDNVYAHNQISRVEICNDPVYSACTIPPEIQTIRSWTDTSIDITYNAGSLPSDQYVFVVDNNGVVSGGFQIVGPDSTPSAGFGAGLKGQAYLSGKAIFR